VAPVVGRRRRLLLPPSRPTSPCTPPPTLGRGTHKERREKRTPLHRHPAPSAVPLPRLWHLPPRVWRSAARRPPPASPASPVDAHSHSNNKVRVRRRKRGRRMQPHQLINR
jgi:hypothetical protein